MADIKMVKYHALPIEQAKTLVQRAADELAAKYEVSSDWEDNTLRFQRSGVDGEMHVTESEIRLTVTLGWLLRPFKAQFVEAIEHQFDRLPTAQPGKALKTASGSASKTSKTARASKTAAKKSAASTKPARKRT